jgi:hypothetical protein
LLAQQPRAPNHIQSLQYQSAQQPFLGTEWRVRSSYIESNSRSISRSLVHYLANCDQRVSRRHIIRGLPHDDPTFLGHVHSAHRVRRPSLQDIRLSVPPSIAWTQSTINATYS